MKNQSDQKRRRRDGVRLRGRGLRANELCVCRSLGCNSDETRNPARGMPQVVRGMLDSTAFGPVRVLPAVLCVRSFRGPWFWCGACVRGKFLNLGRMSGPAQVLDSVANVI